MQEAARRQRSTLASRDHRPLPMPLGPWVQGQTWERLLFAHWPVPYDALRAAVPDTLELDTFAGEAWLGVAPFVIRWLHPRGAPALISFPELNVRTYVLHDGEPGIFFFTLEAASALAVAGARLTYRLPYRHADMSVRREGEWTSYRSHRPGARFEARYRPIGDVFTAAPGTLEHWLIERYRLYTRRGYADIHHRPWPLQPAEAEIAVNTFAAGPPAHLHYAARLDVLVWPPRTLNRTYTGTVPVFPRF
jgi:uncharacterized protein YqjF (DUF2071 family)